MAWGRLDAAGDVFFLNLDDLIASEAGTAGDLRGKAAKARAEYDREMTRRAVPRWMTSDGECIFGVQAEDSEGVLTGLPVSAGTHEGRVRVILHPAGARLEPGMKAFLSGLLGPGKTCFIVRATGGFHGFPAPAAYSTSGARTTRKPTMAR